jgi:hypothetical protein
MPFWFASDQSLFAVFVKGIPGIAALPGGAIGVLG